MLVWVLRFSGNEVVDIEGEVRLEYQKYIFLFKVKMHKSAKVVVKVLSYFSNTF